MCYKAIESATNVPDKTVQKICNALSSKQEADNPKIEEKKTENQSFLLKKQGK